MNLLILFKYFFAKQLSMAIMQHYIFSSLEKKNQFSSLFCEKKVALFGHVEKKIQVI
jgi:hypothetical protein